MKERGVVIEGEIFISKSRVYIQGKAFAILFVCDNQGTVYLNIVLSFFCPFYHTWGGGDNYFRFIYE